MATKLSHVEHEAKQSRQQFAYTEQTLIAQHREQANAYELAAQAEVQQMVLRATIQHHAAQSATQELNTSKATLEHCHNECVSLRTQLSEALARMAAAAATGGGTDTTAVIHQLRTHHRQLADE